MTWAGKTSGIRVGDRVAVAARYLRSTGQYTGNICFARGTVTELKTLGEITLATVAWEGSPEDVPDKLNVLSLSKVTKERGVMDFD